jgi:hypothetical protein
VKFKAFVIGVVVLVVGILVIFVLPPQQRVITCGTDENGRPYAKVLIMNLLGGYHNANWTGVTFSYEGLKKSDSVSFDRPAHSISTTTVHSHYVPKGNRSGRALTCSAWKNY